MAKDPNILALRIDGTDYLGWTSVSVTRSIEHAAAAFSLDVTECWPGQDDPIRIHPGDGCEIHIGSDLLLTGYVEDVDVSHSGTDHTISVSGHSRTVDLVDCSCVSDTGPLQFKAGQTILQIATALAQPYGITVLCDQTGLTKLPKFVPEVGETVYEAIERLAREESLLVTDDRLGRLVLTRLGDQEAPALEHPGNILRASGAYHASDRFSEYRVKGQRVGDDNNWGDLVAGSSASVADDGITRRRVKVIKGEKQMDKAAAKRRATWEAVTRAGKSAQIEVTVAGWRASDGLLYEVNALHPVRDAVIGVDAILLAIETEFHLDPSGMLTTIRLAPPGAYTPEPPKSRKHPITKGIGPWSYGAV